MSRGVSAASLCVIHREPGSMSFNRSTLRRGSGKSTYRDFTAPLVCEQIPVSLLVLVNAMIPKPGETPSKWWKDTGYYEAKRENRRAGRDADAPFDPLFEFFHDVPQPVIDEAWAQGEPRQSEAVFNSKCNVARWPAIATRVLVGRDDRFLPVEFQNRVARERLRITADEMSGGHLVALSQPAELSERLLADSDKMNAG